MEFAIFVVSSRGFVVFSFLLRRVVIFLFLFRRFLLHVLSFCTVSKEESHVALSHLRLKEKPAAKFIAADFSHLTIYKIKILILLYLPAQVIRSSSRASSCLTAKGIRERRGALLFARRRT